MGVKRRKGKRGNKLRERKEIGTYKKKGLTWQRVP